MNLTVTGLINEGSYGRVYKSFDNATGINYAVKERKFHQKEENFGIPSDILREIVLLKKLNHVNIVKPVQVEIDHKAKLYRVILEYFEHDMLDLINMYRTTNNRIPINSIKLMIKQLLTGLEYLHSKMIIHRDIKPSNILVTKELKVILADFGFAKHLVMPLRTMSKNVGTMTYRAPELLTDQDSDYGASVDIWATGCIMINLIIRDKFIDIGDERSVLIKLVSVIGKEKFEACEIYKSFLEEIKGLGPLTNGFKIEDLKARLNDSGYDLIRNLMEPDPLLRIEAIEALKHPWFNE